VVVWVVWGRYLSTHAPPLGGTYSFELLGGSKGYCLVMNSCHHTCVYKRHLTQCLIPSTCFGPKTPKSSRGEACPHWSAPPWEHIGTRARVALHSPRSPHECPKLCTRKNQGLSMLGHKKTHGSPCAQVHMLAHGARSRGLGYKSP
jgi:hypothetical protein